MVVVVVGVGPIGCGLFQKHVFLKQKKKKKHPAVIRAKQKNLLIELNYMIQVHDDSDMNFSQFVMQRLTQAFTLDMHITPQLHSTPWIKWLRLADHWLDKFQKSVLYQNFLICIRKQKERAFQ